MPVLPQRRNEAPFTKFVIIRRTSLRYSVTKQDQHVTWFQAGAAHLISCVSLDAEREARSPERLHFVICMKQKGRIVSALQYSNSPVSSSSTAAKSVMKQLPGQLTAMVRFNGPTWAARWPGSSISTRTLACTLDINRGAPNPSPETSPRRIAMRPSE